MLSEVNESLYLKRENSKLNIVLNVLIIIVAIALIFEVVFNSMFTGIYVVGVSMNDTLTGADTEKSSGGDYVYVDRHAKPTYEDIVVVMTDETDESGKKVSIIKRVIALGGDTVKLDNGVLWVKYSQTSLRYTGVDDFVRVPENYINPDNNDGDCDHRPQHSEPLTFPQLKNGQLDEEGYYVEEDCMFLMGDNRNCSLDSRRRGSFKVAALYGVVTQWSISNKSFYSGFHQFFHFDLPGWFGFKNK